MRKLIDKTARWMIVTAVCTVVATLTISHVMAATPADVTLRFTIPGSKIVEFRAAFLAYMPNNQMIPDPENPGEEIQKYTDKQWFLEKLRQHLKKILDRGNDLRNDAAPVYVTDPNAFTVTIE